MNDKKKNILGKLKFLFYWHIIFAIILLFVAIGVFFINSMTSMIILGVDCCYIIFSLVVWFYYRPVFMKNMVNFAGEYAKVQHKLIDELEVPYVLLDEKGRLMWVNQAFEEIIGDSQIRHSNIFSVLPELDKTILMVENETFSRIVKYEDRTYHASFKKMTMDSSLDGNSDGEQASFLSMYLFDYTELNQYKKQIADEQFVVGLVYIDNIEEALEGVDDARRSLFVGLVDKRMNKYFAADNAIIRKMESDKYFVVFTHQYLEKMIADKFNILEDVKNLKPGNDKNITISIAIGTDPSGYAKSYELAKGAMDLALGRGGDQAVVKNVDKVSYFGGKSQQSEKNDRVKVRMKALALKQIFEGNDDILIMGHKNADTDSFGSCIGIYSLARKYKKKPHIVINNVTSTVEPFMDKFIKNPDYNNEEIGNIFYTSEEALEHASSSTVLIVMDVNKPDLTECPDLLNICKKRVVFDHHRQGDKQINDTMLSYVDSSASSACEIVCEMSNYISDGKFRNIEADAMYSGIVIDTDGFNIKSGPRTFEAAAILRRNGADVNRVRKMLRNDMNEYKAVAKAVSMAEVYKECYAISIFNGNGIKTPSIGGAQAANELLDIRGIKASFVFTQVDDVIFVSARSIDEVNVQIIMEKLGGGGHMTVAGAQLTGESVESAISKLKDTLDEMMDNQEI